MTGLLNFEYMIVLMTTLKIVTISILIIITIIALIVNNIINKEEERLLKKKETLKKWELNDKIYLKSSTTRSKLKLDSNGFATLLGWELDYVYLLNNTGGTTKISMEEVDYNHSFTWRENLKRCELCMGKKAVFKVNEEKTKTKEPEKLKKDFSNLTELECRTKIKQAKENRDLELVKELEEHLNKLING